MVRLILTSFTFAIPTVIVGLLLGIAVTWQQSIFVVFIIAWNDIVNLIYERK